MTLRTLRTTFGAVCPSSAPAAVPLAVALLAGGCASPSSPRVVMPVFFEQTTPVAAPRYPADFASHEAGVRGVAALLARELRLPVPEQVTVYLYGSRAVFEQGLVSDGRLPVARAAELGAFAGGVGKRRQLLLHDEGRPPSGREWLHLVAHELTHVAQIELAQGEGLAEQWLVEGMAEWVAFTILERLGLDYLADRRLAALGGVRNHPALRGQGRLDLASLGTSRGFTVRNLREGSLPTYQLAFLLTDYLVRRHGFDTLPVYFRGFAAGRGRLESFRLSFGQTLQEFEVEIVAHLGQVSH